MYIYICIYYIYIYKMSLNFFPLNLDTYSNIDIYPKPLPYEV